jgi:hypothetical protein
MRNITRLMVFLLLALPAFAEHDFLTTSEADQVREVQDPVPRIQLYLTFARQRLDQIQSTLAKNRPGRSGEIRQLLEDYTSIVDAISTVSDDALIRKADLTGAPAIITEGEKKFVDQLKKMQDSSPSDLEMYSFALTEAIEATSDSIDTANEDLGVRGKEVNERVASERRSIEEVNAAERQAGLESDAVSKAEAAAAQASKPRPKPPTLYRPGEKPEDGTAAPKPKE